MGCQPKGYNPGSESGKEAVELKRRYIMKALTINHPGTFGSSGFENALSGFDRYLDSFFRDNFLTPSERILDRVPSVDVRETEKAYILDVELPGFDEKDIEVRMDGNHLTIESKQDEKKEEANGNYLVRERRALSFSRSFRLPENIDPEGISASFKNGILNLEINKRAETQAKVIKITKN